jgi:hypothetical protein
VQVLQFLFQALLLHTQEAAAEADGKPIVFHKALAEQVAEAMVALRLEAMDQTVATI